MIADVLPESDEQKIDTQLLEILTLRAVCKSVVESSGERHGIAKAQMPGTNRDIHENAVSDGLGTRINRDRLPEHIRKIVRH